MTSREIFGAFHWYITPTSGNGSDLSIRWKGVMGGSSAETSLELETRELLGRIAAQLGVPITAFTDYSEGERSVRPNCKAADLQALRRELERLAQRQPDLANLIERMLNALK